MFEEELHGPDDEDEGLALGKEESVSSTSGGSIEDEDGAKKS